MTKRTIPGSIVLTLFTTLAVGGCQQAGSDSPSLSSLTGAGNDQAATSSMMNTVSDTTTLVSRTTPGTATDAKLDVAWLDSDVFDRQLSSAMSKSPSEIHVNLDTGANQVPARINTWFGEVTDRGGHVTTMTQTAWAQLNGEQTAEGVQTRGLFLLELLPFAFQLIQSRIHEEATYGPSKNYDAILVTNNTRDHIQMLVFKHKEPAQPSAKP
jgi:hypothetical protein